MLQNPHTKYQAFPPIHLPDRQWPSRSITQAPIWMSTDLRDGNQALFEPMSAAVKLQLFKALCACGFKDIEVAFPSASQTEFDFVRALIEQQHIPADVNIEVLTQAREPLIRRTMQSLQGAKRAIVHVYNATSQPFREHVFGLQKAEVIALAVNAVQLIKTLTAEQPDTLWQLEYSPETFSGTELDFALEICNAVTAAWGATPDNKVILNLPSTVELATPNVYADQIEWMHRHLQRRDSIILSVHPHNDRGTAIAAAELALMAGADRVEGCLFGNGERTGNVDLITLALNLYTQGIAPNLDLSDINGLARTVEQCTQLPIHPRHPYVGDLVFTAFSGSHQDAIKKGFASQVQGQQWQVPYLPVDPQDIGRSYESIIRINSQSGKGGIAYLLEAHYGMVMPRRLQVAFSGVVQAAVEQQGSEMQANDLWQLFSTTYLEHTPLQYLDHQLFAAGNAQGIHLNVALDGVHHQLTGQGNGPIDAAVHALESLNIMVVVRSYEERSVAASDTAGDAKACAFVELVATSKQNQAEVFGVGMDNNIVTAALKAVISGVNRLHT